ncbi:MAG: hypothetical protein H5T62_08755 [Anaerolineae bacterium]|nr:hypothetical protein [Anaerolineae bacterium]
MPGKGFAAGFSRGAAQAGSAYLLGQGLKGEPLSVGEATASTVFGGMGGGVGDIVAAHLEVHVLSHARSGTSAMAGRVGVETIGPTADAFFSFLQEQFMKHLQSQDSSVVRSYQLEGPVPATGPYPTHNRPDFE